MTKRLPCRFRHSFGPFNMLTVHKFSDTGLYKHLSNPAFCSLELQKQMTSGAYVFFQSLPNFILILTMQKKILKIFFDFEMIAFELVALNTRF